MADITDTHHVQVLYDTTCFGVIPCDATIPKYRMWFWDIAASLYDISAIATAESIDGINWMNKTSLTQNPFNKLITGAVGWNRGSYGPVNLFYQADATNAGDDPWNYGYVMYYNGTNGSAEETGLAYSDDGLYWTAYSADPVLQGSATAAWDCDDSVYGTVYIDSNGFHFYYSGGGDDDGFGGCLASPSNQGIGYAFSTDGKVWEKNSEPIFHKDDGVDYRNSRVYTPNIIDDGSGTLKMYYTARATGFNKKVGLAILN